MNAFEISARSGARLGLPRTLVRAAAGLLALVAASTAAAMDLRQAYEAAVTRDAAILASRAGAQAERERLPQAQAQRLPNVGFSATRNYNDLGVRSQNNLGQPLSAHHNYPSSNMALTLRQPIYRPYVAALVDQAEAQVASAEASLDNDEQTLAVRVAEAYFEVLMARDQLDLIAAQKRSFEAQLVAAHRGLQAGTGTRTDIDEAQARVDMSRAQELEATQNLDYVRRRMATMVGATLETLAHLDVQRFVAEAPQPADVDAWERMAEDANPELRALRAQVDVAQQEIAKARAGHKPTLDAVAQWSRSDSDSVTAINTRYKQGMIGLQLTIPLYAGGAVNSQVREAVARHEQARDRLEATRLDLGVRVHREHRGMTEGRLRVAALEQAVRSAEVALKSSRMSLAAGARTTLDVLNAEQQRTQALRDLAQARYMYLLSRLRLQVLAGMDRALSIEQANAVLVVH